jgi:pimeloyl-ACP methyl ester carboxylesterase
MVAAKAAERFPDSWDGLLLTSSAVGGPLAYDFRLDLRVIYQYLCNNHPKPEEPDYPLCLGLPRDSTLTLEELTARAEECLGVLRPQAQRSPEQARRLKTLVDVLKIPESAVIDQLRWATWTLRDVVEKLGGSFLGNATVRYSGSDDDAALNAGVKRYRPDPAASARFAAECDYTGRFPMPVISAHGIRDETCLVEVHDTLRSRMRTVGCEHNLVQTFVDSDQHSYLGDEIYTTLIAALLDWSESGKRPSPRQIADRCRAAGATAQAPCGFVADYLPGSLVSRIHPR